VTLADLWRLVSVGSFRRLLALRLLSQAADGVVQAALTAYLIFSPERQTTPAAIAALTAAILLPFTILGPFTGVVLDRWSRRDVLVAATGLRAGLALTLAGALAADLSTPVLFVVVVAGFAVNRFVLAGLSAALPHVVTPDTLLTANAVAPTAGTLAYVLGLGAGAVVDATTGGDATPVLAAGLLWLVAGAVGAGFARPQLGPDHDRGDGADLPPPGHAVRLVLEGLRSAAEHLRDRREAAAAIGLVAAQRLVAATTLMSGVLLYRSSYAAPGDPADGLAGLSVAVLAAGAGFVLAAGVTPWVAGRWSPDVAVTAGLLIGAPALTLFAATLAEPALVGAAFALGLGGQLVKICADTAVQAAVADGFRGRVFVLYDMAFNTALVGGAVLGALWLPPSGRASGLLLALTGALLGLAVLSVRGIGASRTP